MMKFSKIPVAQSIVLISEMMGLRNIVISPGSRNAPLVVGFSSNKFFKCYSIIDERSAGFFALGIAQQLEEPVVLLCTSGSALLNYSPAISEAYYSEIPLIVISADRPSYKINIGDGQTIDQTNVFGKNILRSINLKQDVAHSSKKIILSNIQKIINTTKEREIINDIQSKVQKENIITIKSCINDCVLNSKPVHINVPMEEPLYEFFNSKTVHIEKLTPTFKKKVSKQKFSFDLFKKYSKIIVLIGCSNPGLISNDTIVKLKQNKNVVILKESTSNIYDISFFGNIDRLLAPIELLENSKEIFKKLKPDLLITLGGMIVSKKIKSFLRKFPPLKHLHVGDSKANDTFFKNVKHYQINPNLFFEPIKPNLDNKKSFFSQWKEIDNFYAKYHNKFIKTVPFSDLKVFSILINRIPSEYQIQVSNSSAIRYIQLFNLKNHNLTYCNRGVSGIDGSTSTAVGASSVIKKPVILITGDLSFFYDINGLWNNYIKNDFRIIIINNGGGGIFRILPGFKENKIFSKFIETKQTSNAKFLARHFGFIYINKKSTLGIKIAMHSFFKKSSKPKILEINTSSEISSITLKNYFKYLSDHHEK